MKKTSAYAKKRKAQGRALQGRADPTHAYATIFTAIAASRDRDAGAFPGGEFMSEACVENANRGEAKVREAFNTLLQPTAPEAALTRILDVDSMLILGFCRASRILFGDVEPERVDLSTIPETGQEALLAIAAGRKAMTAVFNRFRAGGSWGMSDEERVDIADGIDVSVSLFRASTVQQMHIAHMDANRMLSYFNKKGKHE